MKLTALEMKVLRLNKIKQGMTEKEAFESVGEEAEQVKRVRGTVPKKKTFKENFKELQNGTRRDT